MERPDDHVHDLEWQLSPYDDGKSRYADVQVIFRCGCTLGQGNIRKFSQDMYRQGYLPLILLRELLQKGKAPAVEQTSTNISIFCAENL